MKDIKASIIIIGLINLISFSNGFGQTLRGTISSNQTWSGTINLTGDVKVTNGILTIQPGTIVRFPLNKAGSNYNGVDEAGIIVEKNGSINAVGTESQKIIFTSSSSNPQPNDWREIDLEELENNNLTQFKYCVFE